MKPVSFLLCLSLFTLFYYSCGNKSNINEQPDTTSIKTGRTDKTETDMTFPETDTGNIIEKDKDTSPGILTLEKTTYAPDEQMEISFTASSGAADNAWVGIILSDVTHGNNQVNDDNDIDFDVLAGQTSGFLFMLAPHFTGNYDLRMSDPDTGKKMTSVSFTVK
jgi:hypothetical protein